MATSVLHGSIEEPTLSLRKLTIVEYHKLGEAGILHPNDRIELIDGLLVQMAPIGPEHQFIVEELIEIFTKQKRGRFKVGPGRPIPITDFNEPQPDTTLHYDSGRKLLAYENARIPEYWIVDVQARAVRVFRLTEGKYEETRYTEGSVTVQAFPDVMVRLEDLF